MKIKALLTPQEFKVRTGSHERIPFNTVNTSQWQIRLPHNQEIPVLNSKNSLDQLICKQDLHSRPQKNHCMMELKTVLSEVAGSQPVSILPFSALCLVLIILHFYSSCSLAAPASNTYSLSW